MQNVVGQPQTVQVPNYSGVNIQIFNPSVTAPGGSPPVSTVNSPTYSAAPATYPANYYTQNLNPGASSPNSGVQNTPSAPAEPKKTEKKEITQLTDDYIKTVENYLNSQDPKIRLMGAKEVLARLQEDDSRKNDVALNALVDKMLQDPSQQVKFLALAILESGTASGDAKTVQLLQKIQQSHTSYGEDSLQASKILLKMSGTKVQKEFEVKDTPSAKKKTEKE